MADQKNHQGPKAKRERQNNPPASGGRRPRAKKRAKALVDLDELRELIAVLKENGLTEFALEREGFRIHLRQGIDYQGEEASIGSAQPQTETAPPAKGPVAAVPTRVADAAADQDLHIIPSPIVGTFYRSPSPSAESFVKIGSRVEPETVVCIIEAMKLMNEIQAESSGEVVKIYVENGQPVEYGQPLFGIKE
jgi:acetyl-CoA carboxylase biotin carboxyl carrier protein